MESEKTDLAVSRATLVAAVLAGLWLLQSTPVTAQTSPATLPDLKLSTAGNVKVVAVQDDGKVIIAGTFNAVNDVPRTNIARLNPNGSVDLTWSAIINNSVNCIAISGTNIYVGGSFFTVNGLSRDRIARIGIVDGSVDPTWNPTLLGNGFVDAIALAGTNVYVAGGFTNIGGLTRNRIARLNTSGNGTVDSTWDPNANNLVERIAVNGDDVFVAGLFTNIGGEIRTNIAKLSTMNAGQADPDWNPNPRFFHGVGIPAFTVGGTNIYVSGDFTNIGGFSSVGLTKLSTTGSGTVDTNWTPAKTFNTPGYGGLALADNTLFVINADLLTPVKLDAYSTGTRDTNWNATFDTPSVGLTITPSGLIAAGFFRLCNGEVSLSIAKLDLITGARDAGFPAYVQNPGAVYTIARQPDGKLILGGDFFFAGGLPRQNLARINQDGTLDSTWAPTADSFVNKVVVSGTNAFVGGFFRTVNGLPRTNLAKINTLGSDAVDPLWDARISITSGGVGVRALAVNGTNLFVSGDFDKIGGQNRSHLAKIATIGNGDADTLWQADTLDARVLAVSDTNLFVGGTFTNIGGINRRGFAKLSILDSSVETNYTSVMDSSGSSGVGVFAIAIEGTNLFVGGSFTNIGGLARQGLAKLSTVGTGNVDSSWSPFVADSFFGITDLALGGTNLYVLGNFVRTIAPARTNLLRVDPANNGFADSSFTFNPAAGEPPKAILANSSGVYVAGHNMKFGGVDRFGLAFGTVAGAPVLIQDTATNLFIARNPFNGPEVTHFRIIAISNGVPPIMEPPTNPTPPIVTGTLLYLSDGVTQLRVGDFITVAQGNAGLKFTTGGKVTVVSALNNKANGAGTMASSLTMTTNPAPTFKFTSATYSVREGQGNIVVIVRKFGNGAGTVDYATSDLTATGGFDYQTRSGTLNFSAADKFKNILITIADDLQAEGDEQFAVTLTNAGVGASIAGPASIVTITDNDLIGLSDSLTMTVLPTAPTNSSGALTVSLQPTNANGQWRLLGELNWHDGGVIISGLTTANYGIEFRPVNGYREPQTVTIPISSGMTNQLTFFYAAITNLAAGNLSVIIQPNDVATATDATMRGQWRRQGTTNWFNSGDVIPNLNAGNYALEFKTVPGRVAPPTQLIAVGANATYSAIATYAFDSAPGALTPTIIPFSTATTNEPYLYNGQIQTDAGFGSGFVVKQRVVLTAAHVLFDDVQFSYVTTVRWFFQRYRDQLEPVLQTPRGWYVFDGYAAQRQLDNSPGISTPASQNLDVAAMYFLENAGRGGYGGYLSSDADNNEFLLSANNKFLVGYPLDGVADADKGKLFATTPANLTFTHLYTSIFSTTNVASFPGNSGGPLYVQADVNKHFPAAIYLGGSGQTLVRAINSEVVDLINRAEASGNGGGNSTGGGAIPLSPGQTTSLFGTGILNVSLTPSNAVNVRPGWRISGLTDTNYFDEAAFTTVALIGGGSYPIEFKPIPGFITPSNRTVTIAVGGLVTIQGNYIGIRPQLILDRANGLTLSGGGTGATYRVEFATNFPQAVWTPLTSFTLINTSFSLSNTVPPTNGNRFYRAVLVP